MIQGNAVGRLRSEPSRRSLRISTIARWREEESGLRVIDYAGFFAEYGYPNDKPGQGWEIGLGRVPIRFFNQEDPDYKLRLQEFVPEHVAKGDSEGLVVIPDVNLLVPKGFRLALRIKYDPNQEPWIGPHPYSFPIFRRLSIEQMRQVARWDQMIDHI